ncbi:MAG: phosphotyrosine protein phosphatase [Gammaproteobacteria bacterium]|nr:MAG: phosphotyrosine protein phosphatase [Gammaproteobacteria bacterium]
MTKVLFVCLGNICRSPTAQGTFRKLVQDQGLDGQIETDSAGTAPYHIGKTPDMRAQKTAASRGIDISDLRARQIKASDFEEFDYILAMDNANLEDLLDICPDQHKHKVMLFLSFIQAGEYDEVPDPYYGGQAGFDIVFDLVQQASEALLDRIQSS